MTDDHPALAVARSLYPALATGDREVLDAILAPDFVGETTPGLPLGLGRRYDGATDMRRNFWSAIGREFDVIAEPASVQALPDGRVVVHGRYAGSARSTGTTLEADFVHTLAIRDGRITALTQVTDSAAWAAALTVPDANSAAPADPPLTSVRYEVTGGVARITLDRPDAANAIDVAVARDLRTLANRCARDPSVRAVLIDGAGRRFCAGGDIGVFTGHTELPRLLDGMITDFHLALSTLADLPVPVVCAVQGAAAGGGLGLLWCADVVVAADDAKFATGYAAIGLSADGGNSWYLPRLVGARVAAQMLLQNRVLSAPDALAYGLVSETVPAGQLAGRADEIAAGFAAGPAASLAAMRALARGSWDRSLAEQFDAERRAITAVAATADAAEGVAAFAARRSPRFGEDGS